MKSHIRNSLIALLMLVGIASIPLSAGSVAAIDVFKGADCGASGGGAGNGAGNTGGAGGANNGNSNSGNAGSGGSAGGSTDICGAVQQDSVSNLTQNVITTLFIILGAIAVIMIIIGGIRYTTSNGDASQTKSAKDTILYSVIGLVVAIMAYAIVAFVLGALD